MPRITLAAALAAIALSTTAFSIASPAMAQVVITCPPNSGDNIDNINNAIQAAPFGPVAITVNGECTAGTSGNVVRINRDDVILIGDLSGSDAIKGRIYITGDRVFVSSLDVVGNGSGDGITVDNGGSAIISDVEVKGHDRGVVARMSSMVRIFGSEIKDSAQQNLIVLENSSARLTNTKVKSAGSTEAIGIFRLGFLRLFGGNNEITNTVGRAISLAHGSQVRQDGGHDEITGDIAATALSEVELRDFEMSGDFIGSEKALIRLRNGTLTGNIVLRRDSEVTFNAAGSGVTVSGTLECADDESSYFAPANGISIGGVNCSGY